MIKVIDNKGKLVPVGTPDHRLARKIMNGQAHFHYEIYVTIKGDEGKRKYVRKRYWLPDNIAAEEMERKLKSDRPIELLSWQNAHALWLAENRNDFSVEHAKNSEATIRRWTDEHGVDSTIEETTLAQFTDWVYRQAKIGKGRGGQIRRNHLLAIARWARSRGLVATIPFEHSPMPKARTEKKRAATLAEFYQVYNLIPEPMRYLWLFLGLTGVRLSAACGLTDKNVGKTTFRVFTKFRKWVEYPLTEPVKNLIISALAYRKRIGANLDNVFCTMKGRPWNKQTFNNSLRRKLEGTDVKDITSHQLRHMAGTILASKNFSADMIQAGLAHDNRESGEEYIDQTLDMRGAALTALANEVTTGSEEVFDFIHKSSTKSEFLSKAQEKSLQQTQEKPNIKKRTVCPCCHHNIGITEDLEIVILNQ